MIITASQFFVASPSGGEYSVRGLVDHQHVLVLSRLPVRVTVRDGAGTPVERPTEWAGEWRSTVHADGRELFSGRGERFSLTVVGSGCAAIVLLEE